MDAQRDRPQPRQSMGRPRTTPDQPELFMARTLDAPRKFAFRAWTDPGYLARYDAFLRMGTNERWSPSLEKLAALIARRLLDERKEKS